ncbi:MAG: AmmeMemoRadiSam system protein B, partial [bacterium]|nr:AmmeMemoRadiSam system protein B [bacterium]
QKQKHPVAVQKELQITHLSTMLDPAFFDEAYEKAPVLPAIPADTRGAVVPHHLLPAPITAAFFDQFPWQPKRVVIIGPDHLDRGKNLVSISRGAWKTSYGLIEPDTEVIDAIVAVGAAQVEESVFDGEHSIAALVPFIKRSFPEARIIPIVVRLSDNLFSSQTLAQAIPSDDETLVIASVDFSHGQTDRVAQFHDRLSLAVLSSMDKSLTFLQDIKSYRKDLPDINSSSWLVMENSRKVRDKDSLTDLEIDSPPSLRVLFEVMGRNGSQKMTLLKNTNSALVSRDPEARETTSYVYAAFSKGEPVPDDTVTILAFGDMMFDRTVRSWMDRQGEEYPFEHIRGLEDRFFRGVDFIIGNLEGAISERRSPEKEIDFAFDETVAAMFARFNFNAVSLANNHAFDQGRKGLESTQAALAAAGVGYFGDQVRDDTDPWMDEVRGKRVAMFGYNMTDNDFNEEAARARIADARAASDLVVIQIHWGAEYQDRPQGWQVALGRRFIDWGADVVIGGHPHVMQGMEVYKNRPIFWSLGNFIFDQYWSEETQRALAVGLALNKTGATVYLYPLISEASQPRLATGAEDRDLLLEFVRRSDLSPDLQNQAKEGKLNLSF